MKNLYLLLVLCVLTSCSKQYTFKRDVHLLKKELLKLKESDQLVRSHSDYLDFYYGISSFQSQIDSLTWIDDSDGIDSLLKNYLPKNNNYKSFNENKKASYLENRKSMDLTINYIDSINTISLIQLTKKYGFPSYERLIQELGTDEDKKLTSSPHLIFVHSPPYFFPKIREIVINEYKNKRLDKNVCSHIFWHLNGRKGNPFPDDFCHCKVDTLR